MKAIAFCGPHNSGKTTLIKEVVNGLSLRGYSVGVVKSTKHSSLFREPGKDTTVFLDSPASEVGLVCRSESVVFYKRRLEVDDLLSLFDCDFLIFEGFRKSFLPKVAVFTSYEEDYWKGVENVVAVVTDSGFSENLPWSVPRFSRGDVDKVVNLVERLSYEHVGASLWVNGRKIEMKPFVESLLRDVVLGVVRNLKGAESPRRVKIEIVL